VDGDRENRGDDASARSDGRFWPEKAPVILITGAGGLVGHALAACLPPGTVRLGLHSIPSSPALPAAARQPRPVRFDFHDPATFGPALDGVDRVFLLRPPQLARARRDFGPFVAAMRRVGIRRVVFLSVRGAGRNPLLPHHRIERLVRRSGIDWTFLRPNDFMQNLLTVHCADIQDRGEIWAPAARGRTSFVDVRDVAAAAALVLQGDGHAGRPYTLTGPEALGFGEVAALLSEVAGRIVRYRDPGVLAFVRHMRARGLPPAQVAVMLGVYGAARLGLAAEVSPDLPELLGRPATPFKVFAANHADAWRSAGG
jgi:uncharacterized protein YbjT (DUF2867 family)